VNAGQGSITATKPDCTTLTIYLYWQFNLF